MRYIVTVLILLPVFGLLVGCASTPSATTYLEARFGLEAVQRPAEVAERWGEYEIRPADEDGYVYEDELVSIVVVPTGGTFGMEVLNRSEHSIHLLWDQASYVAPDGYSSPVVSGETSWADIGDSQPARVIPAGSRASLRAMPTANLDRAARASTGFVRTAESCADVAGVSARLLLPFEIQGTVNEYTLHFEVREAAIVTSEMRAANPLRPGELQPHPISRHPCEDGGSL